MKSPPTPSPNKPKRGYIKRTPIQKDIIRQAYFETPYPCAVKYAALAKETGIPIQSVRDSFKRLRDKYDPNSPAPLEPKPKPHGVKWSKYTTLVSNSDLSRDDSRDSFYNFSSEHTSNDGFSESPPSDLAFEQSRQAFLDSVISTLSLSEISYMQTRLELTAAYLSDVEVDKLLQD